MAGTNLVKTLTAKYAKLLGEYEFAERMVEDAIGLDAIIEASNRCDARKEEIGKTLEAIETVIWLFEPDWNPAAVRPNYPRQRHFARGDLSKQLFDILKDAETPLTRHEIAHRLAIADPTDQEIKRIENGIQTTLNDRKGRTIQVASYNPTRWALIPTENAKAGTNKRRQRKIPISLPRPEAQRRARKPAVSETVQSRPCSARSFASGLAAVPQSLLALRSLSEHHRRSRQRTPPCDSTR
jgi:hypothetical protein